MTSESTGNTGTKDVTFNIISILYHALQGAETYDQYIQDAEQSGNSDIVYFYAIRKRKMSGAQTALKNYSRNISAIIRAEPLAADFNTRFAP
jgi:hypothetical protein